MVALILVASGKVHTSFEGETKIKKLYIVRQCGGQRSTSKANASKNESTTN